jgi:hypothetical protein
MFDVFYSGKKPGQLAHVRRADSIEHAQELSRTRYFWWIHYLADLDTWDWLFEPPPWQSQQRHAWPNQHQPDSGVYLVPRAGYTDTNYHASPVINHKTDQSFWHIPRYIDAASIDSQWSPDPMDPPYIYEFPVEWGWDNIGGPEYRVPGATERKFVVDFVSRTAPDLKSWHHHCPADLPPELLRWRPNPADPPYDYVFGNQWHPPEVMPTVEYRVPGATSKKYMSELKAVLPAQHIDHWRTLEHCNWDYSWIPDPGDPPYVYVFGNQWWPAEKWPTVEYHVPGATERKYMDYPRAALRSVNTGWRDRTDHGYAFDWTWQPDPGDPPYIYVFGNQWHSAEVMPTVEWRHPAATNETATKYVDWPRAELAPDRTAWTVPEGVDDSQIDFSWRPDPGEPPYMYQFATQHQKTGGPVYTVPGATETKYLENIQIKIEAETVPIIEIDHLDGAAGQIPNTLKKIRYFDNYRDTLIRLAKSLLGQHEFVWVCSSICDYTNFDFTWHPEQWQQTMLHVFASDNQKFGDTFYMHVPSFAARAEKKELLEWYSVNFVKTAVPRRPMPVILHDADSQVDAVKTTQWAGPLATFTNYDYVPGNLVTVPLWREQTKTIVPVSDGAGSVVVPRAAVPYIKTQLYDYPYIDRTQRILQDSVLDIVFISNGEINADMYFEHLQWTKNSTRVAANQIRRVSGVNGRVAAYQEAARHSRTPWFFAVFAKLEVTADFDWSWQPDRMQQPKHYIFHAHNPVNGLVYGHQAMIAYNKKLVLENKGEGLDFTLDQPHEVVPIVSGTAMYHESDWMCWRTAFREVLKLKASLPDVESEHRLNRWLTVDTTDGQWSRKGAEDGVEYYDSVSGDFAALKKSYEWEWLASYAFMKRSLTPNQ